MQLWAYASDTTYDTGISCTMVHQAWAVRCAGAVRAETSTDAWWTHASPTNVSRRCDFAIWFFFFFCKTTFFYRKSSFFCYFFAAESFFAKWALSTVRTSQFKCKIQIHRTSSAQIHHQPREEAGQRGEERGGMFFSFFFSFWRPVRSAPVSTADEMI